MRCKAVQHAKNRADVRKTEGREKSGYRSEAVRTVILGAVRGHAARVCGDCRCAGRMYRKAQAGRQGAGTVDGQGWKAGAFCVWAVRRVPGFRAGRGGAPEAGAAGRVCALAGAGREDMRGEVKTGLPGQRERKRWCAPGCGEHMGTGVKRALTLCARRGGNRGF